MRLAWQQGNVPPLVLSGMAVVALGVLAFWRRVSLALLRPVVLWFVGGWFLVHAFTTLTSTGPVAHGFFLSHVLVVAACYLMLPMIQAAILSGLSAVILAGVVLLHPAYDAQVLAATLFTGLLVSFLTVYGHSVRQQQALDPPDLQPAGLTTSSAALLKRISDFIRSRADRERMALLLVEVELLENLQDVYGPLLTSQLMERLARSLRTGLPGADYVWRYGEARFLVLLTDQEQAEAERLGQAMVARACTIRVREGDTLSISGGMAFLKERPVLEDVVALAQARLYRARRAGGRQFLGLDTQISPSVQAVHPR